MHEQLPRRASELIVAATIEQGIGWALDDATPSDLVLITGSLYLVGSARTVLRKRARSAS